jgi:hypothetical protein
MSTRYPLFVLLMLGATACGGNDGNTPSDDDGHEIPDAGNGDGDGDTDDAEAGSTYPGFVPKNCVGDECPYGECGRVSNPACTDSYTKTFDADFADYCLSNPGASYCVGSEPIGPGFAPADTFCINCDHGDAMFEHCRDTNVTFTVKDDAAHCITPL